MDSISKTSIRKPTTGRADSRPNPLVLLLLAVFPLLLLELVPIPILDSFEWSFYDQRMRLRNRLDPQPIGDSIRLVGISEADEERLDSDLFNRQAYMELLSDLKRWGARTATFDLFFDRELETDQLFASALSGSQLRTVLAFSFLRSQPAFTPKGSPPVDFAEAQEIARSGNDPAEMEEYLRAIDSYLFDIRAEEKRTTRDDSQAALRSELRSLIAWTRELRNRLQDRWLWLVAGHEFPPQPDADPHHAGYLRRLAPSILLAAHSHGFANIEKESQEVVRMAPLVYRHRGRLFPQLTLATALAWYEVPFSEVEIKWGKYIRFQPKQPGESPVVLPIDKRGRYLINFREGEEYLNRNPTLSAVILPELREDHFPHGVEAYFKDSFVILGEVISGGVATDVEPIPLQNQFPMVGIHANILDNILKRDVLRVTPLWMRLAISMLLGGAMAAFFHRYRFLKASFLSLLFLLLYILAQYLAFAAYGLVLNVAKPLVGLAIGGLLLFGYVVGAKDRDRRLVRDVFMKSVSPRIGEEILNNYYDEAIWGARREISVLFIDIRGYTTISEAHDPEIVLGLLDRFYDTVSESVFRHEGQVNKFMGDAVLALFGALPEEPDNHAERALRAAVDAQTALRSWAARDAAIARLGVPFDTGAGVNTGEATVGLVGKRRIRIEYTALGDAVNIAARLQTLASTGEVIIGERTMRQIGGEDSALIKELALQCGPVEELPLKGKLIPLPVYRLRIEKDQTRSPK